MSLVRRLLDSATASNKKVVVIGDCVWDKWVTGTLTSCQDGCAKFMQDAEPRVTHGGASNAWMCLTHWPVERLLIGYDRKDWPIKTRYLDQNGKILFRVDEEYSRPKSSQYAGLRRSMRYMTGVSAVLLSDYDKGMLTEQLVRDMVDYCKTYNIPCVADCKRSPGFYKGCILKCNADYFTQRIYSGECGEFPDQLVVTRGADGPIVNRESDDRTRPAVKCANHVGAGDCFAAHLVLALACGFSLKDAAVFAHSAGRVYVQGRYNYSPTPGEVDLDLLSVQ